MVKRFQAALLTLGGLTLLGVAAWMAVDAARFLDQSERAPGRVVDLVSRRVRGSDLHRPVVQFRPAGDAIVVEFVAWPGLWPAPYAPGDEVVVAYRPDAPTDARVVSFRMLWLMPLLTGLFGGACVFAGWHTARAG